MLPLEMLKRPVAKLKMSLISLNHALFWLTITTGTKFQCSAKGVGRFPICKLKWDLLRTSFTACTTDENTFSAPFGFFYVKMEI